MIEGGQPCQAKQSPGTLFHLTVKALGPGGSYVWLQIEVAVLPAVPWSQSRNCQYWAARVTVLAQLAELWVPESSV